MNQLKTIQNKNRVLIELVVTLSLSMAAGLIFNAFRDQTVPLFYESSQIKSNDELTLAVVRTIYRQKEALFIDARKKTDYETGHIPGAINIPVNLGRSEKVELLNGISKDLKIIVYCENVQCQFADRLAREMQYMKFKSVAVFKGGWTAWNSNPKN